MPKELEPLGALVCELQLETSSEVAIAVKPIR
jgi:hypothetical protein